MGWEQLRGHCTLWEQCNPLEIFYWHTDWRSLRFSGAPPKGSWLWAQDWRQWGAQGFPRVCFPDTYFFWVMISRYKQSVTCLTHWHSTGWKHRWLSDHQAQFENRIFLHLHQTLDSQEPLVAQPGQLVWFDSESTWGALATQLWGIGCPEYQQLP